MEKCCVGRAYASSCQLVCLGSLVTEGPDGARLIPTTDATSAGTGDTMHMTATGLVVQDPGPVQGPGAEGIARDLAVAAVKGVKAGGTAPRLTPGAEAGLVLRHGPSLGLLRGGLDLTRGLRHVLVAAHRLVPDPGLVLPVRREQPAAPVPPARKRAQPQEPTDGDKQNNTSYTPTYTPIFLCPPPQNMSTVNFIVLVFLFFFLSSFWKFCI